MAKRRTKKQKQKARHTFTIKWEPGSSKLKSEPSVNRQIQTDTDSASNESKNVKVAQNSAKDINLEDIRKNISKSLIFSALILASEVVLYLVWH